MSFLGLSIGWPLGLIGLLVIPLLVLATLRSRAQLAPSLQRASLALRIVAALLVVFAISDARITWPTRELAVAAVVDGSDSISPVERAEVARRMSAVSNAHRDVAFSFTQLDTAARRTDLESQVTAAVATMRTDRARRIVLATDGRETVGDVRAAADRARRAGVTVDVLPLGEEPPVDHVLVQGIDVPRIVRASQPLTIAARVLATSTRTIRLALTLDGALIMTRTVTATRGTSLHELPLTFPDEGVHEVRITATPDVDVIAANDAWSTLVRVVSPPRVLLVHELAGAEPALAAVYRDARLHVDAVHAADVPTQLDALERYQLVVLDELDLATLRDDQMRAIRAWVEELGGGLLTITGAHPVRREPDVLRDIEPIRPPRAQPEPRPVELILVIDRSGSMQGPGIVGARAAGVAAVRALRPDARVGVVAFSGGADSVMPPQTMDHAEDVTRFVSRMFANGGTDIAAALRAADRIASRDPRFIHHVVLLSDGESEAGPALAAAQALAGRGVSISTITLGAPNSLMNEIARIGRGRYRATQSASALPQLFLREAQFRMPPPERQTAFRPSVARAMPFLDGIDFAQEPPIGGYVLADTKPHAQTVLSTPDGPLLAHWFQGLGQVLSFTSSTSGAWANGWRARPAFRRLFSQMAWEIMRARDEQELAIHVDRDAQHPESRTISVVTQHLRTTPAPLATLTRPGGPTLPLVLLPRAPGVFAAQVDVGERGFLVDAREPVDLEPTAAAAVDRPYPEELAAITPDRATLSAIAEAGGGRVLARAEQLVEPPAPVRVLYSIRLLLLALALSAYLFAVLLVRWPTRNAVAVTVPASASIPPPARVSTPPSRDKQDAA